MTERIRPFALSPDDHHLLVRMALDELPAEFDAIQLRRLAEQKLVTLNQQKPAPTKKALRLIFGEIQSFGSQETALN